jgi:hypothetical protein
LLTGDLPPLYQDLDRASVRAQRVYWAVIVSHFCILVAAGVVSSVSTLSLVAQQRLYAIGAVLLFSGLVLSLVLASNAFEKTWYGGRAGAETVKSLSWKYMLRAKPFSDHLPSKKVDAEFTGALAKVLSDRRELALGRGVRQSTGEPITATMRRVRGLSMSERLAYYVEHRVKNQIGWYARRSESADTMHTVWLWIVVCIQGLAGAGAVAQVIIPSISFNIAAASSTIAGVLVSWSQLRRHRELSQAYGIASHELEFAAGSAMHIQSEAELSEFVNDSESAISREHTMWVARRERPL